MKSVLFENHPSLGRKDGLERTREKFLGIFLIAKFLGISLVLFENDSPPLGEKFVLERT